MFKLSSSDMTKNVIIIKCSNIIKVVHTTLELYFRFTKSIRELCVSYLLKILTSALVPSGTFIRMMREITIHE